MSDTPESAQQPAGAAEQPNQLSIHTQYIKDLSFENPNAPVIFTQLKGNPKIDINVDVTAKRLQDRLAEIVLDFRVEAKSEDDQVAFMVELSYAGLVSVSNGTEADMAERYYLIEAPRLLFPFARSIMATITREGGFPPLLIAPINFQKLYQQRQQTAATDAVAEPENPETAP